MGYHQDILEVLPKVVVAGENAGYLTETGAKLIDPNGQLEAGCLCVLQKLMLQLEW